MQLSPTATSIIAKLPSLKAKELEVVQAALARLERELEEEVPQLYTTLVLVTGSQLPYSKFQNAGVFPTWKLYLPLTMSFASETWPDIQEVERISLLRYLWGLILEDLKQRGIPVLTTTMVRELPHLPMLFDRCFPGYRASGLSHLIIKMMVHA